MVWVIVSALDEETGERFMDDGTDKDGQFSISGLRDTPYTLHVRNSEAPPEAEPVQREHVWPSDSPLDLVAAWSRSRQPRGTIEGRWRDTAGRIADATPPVFLLEDEALTGWEHAQLDGDRLRFDHIAAGRYRVRALSEDDPIHTWDWFELAPGETLDLGLLETEPGGTLLVHLDRSDAARIAQFDLMVVAPTRYFPFRRQVEAGVDSIRIEELSAGSYQLRLAGKGISNRPLEIVIVAHEVLEVTKVAEEGVWIPLELSNPSGLDWAELTLTARAGDETVEQYSFRRAN